METLIVQLDSHHGRLNEFLKVEKENFSLGRALSNDLVLSDPYLSPQQLRFFKVEGHWQLEILDVTNPVRLNDQALGPSTSPIRSGDKLILGRTHLTLLSENHPIETTRTMVLSRWLPQAALRPIVPLAMLGLACLVGAFDQYLNATTPLQFSEFLSGGLVTILFALIWAGLWAFTGRMLHHQPQFFAQLYYSALIFTGLNLLDFTRGYWEYLTNNELFENIIMTTALFVLVATLLKFNLSFATHIKRKWTTALSVSGFCTVMILSFMYIDHKEFETTPKYSAALKPPPMKMVGSQTLDEYLQDFENQFAVVDLEVKNWDKK